MHKIKIAAANSMKIAMPASIRITSAVIIALVILNEQARIR